MASAARDAGVRDEGVLPHNEGEMKMRERENSGNLVTLGLLGLGIAFLIVGICRGECSVVLQKAVNICLECVGIG